MTTGVDRLYLTVRDYDISQAKLDKRIVSTWVDVPDLSTGENLQVEQEKTVRYLNDKATGITVNVNDEGLLCVFNPNRILTATHHLIRPQSELEEALSKVTKHLNSKQIGVDFSGAGVSKIDLCRLR